MQTLAYCRSLRWTSIVIVCTATLLGCDSTSESDVPASNSKPSIAQADSKTVSQDVSALELAAVEFKLGKNGQVAEINLRDVEITDDLAGAISKLKSCVKLTINQTAMSGEGWQQLGKLSNLQQFDLRGSAVSNDQLEAAVSGMPRLRALRLSGKSGETTVEDDGLAVLTNCPDLKALALDHLWVSEQGLAHLKSNRKLEELYLAGTLIDDAGVKLLARLPSIRKLRLAQTTITAAGLEALRTVPLVDLDISECSQVFDDAMLPLGKIKSLERLNLWRDAITDVGVASLNGLTNLEWLNLDNTQLSDSGLHSLQDMTRLAFLHLGSTGVSDDGMHHLSALKSLKDLRVTRTAVTAVGVQVVTDMIPGIEVQLRYTE